MTAAIVPFEFGDSRLSAYSFRGRPCMLAQDVGGALGYTLGGFRSSLSRWQDELIEGVDFDTLTGDGLREFQALSGVSAESARTSKVVNATVLYESGLWLVCLKTDKPSGKALRRTLADEVLPKLARGEFVAPPAVSAEPAPNALEAYREGAALLTEAVEAELLDKREAVLRKMVLLRKETGIDLLAAPTESPTRGLPQAAELAEGQSLIVTKPVDRTGHYSASELGAPYGLPGKVVGAIADRIGGVKGNAAWGKWSPITDGSGRKLNDQWLYSEAAKEWLASSLAAERDRRASKQLPLGKRGGA